jgi:hypothetical protein
MTTLTPEVVTSGSQTSCLVAAPDLHFCLMAAHHYHSRAARRSTPQMTNLELFVTALVVATVIAVLVAFLFVHHDFPLRVV